MATNVGMKPGHEQTLSMHLDGRLPSIACPGVTDHATLRGRHVSACSGGRDGRTVNRLRNGACGVWLGACNGHWATFDALITVRKIDLFPRHKDVQLHTCDGACTSQC